MSTAHVFPKADRLFLTEAEAAAYLTVSLPTFRRWRRSGTGPKYFERGDIIRYRQEDLETFIQDNSQGGGRERAA